MRLSKVSSLVAASLAVGPVAGAQDWSNVGGNAARNGLSTARGPVLAQIAWNAVETSIIAWNPVVDAGRVFVVKQTGFPSNGGSPGDAVVALRQSDGGELWRKTVAYSGSTTTNWTAWVAGASAGNVYVSRAGNGGTVAAPLIALDAATGNVAWTSADTILSGPYDGVIFADDGDPIVGDRTHLTRFDAATGARVWRTARVGSVGGNCGAAASASAVYIADVASGGHVIKKLDVQTGAVLYQSAVMPGFTVQNVPFVSRDGQTVFLHRTQNNATVDKLYAWRDTGASFAPLWNRDIRWTTAHEVGVGPDGSIYTFLPDNTLVRLDPDDGSILNTAGVLPTIGVGNLSPKTAVDSSGIVYISNGWASSPATDGRLWAFKPDLSSTFFTLNLDRQNQGGPTLTNDGALIISDRAGVRAYRSARCLADINLDGEVDLVDFFAFLNAFDTGDILGDLDNQPGVDLGDFFVFFNAFDTGC